MKLNEMRNNAPLSTTNHATLIAHLKAPIKETPYRFLLALIAGALDAAGAGQNIWLSVGKTRAGDTYLITVHTPAGQAYVAGESLLQLAGACGTVLEPSEMT